MASKALLNGKGPLSSELGVIHMKELWRRAHRSIIIHNVALLPGCKTLNMNEWCTDRAEIIFLISIFVFWYYKMCKTKYLYTTHRLIQWYCVSFKKAFFESVRDDCHCKDGSYQVCCVHLLGFQQNNVALVTQHQQVIRALAHITHEHIPSLTLKRGTFAAFSIYVN